MLLREKKEEVPSTSGPITAQGRDRGLALRARMTPFGFMAPAGLLVILFFFIPMVLIIYLSVTNLATTNFTTNVFEMEFVGTENFEQSRMTSSRPKYSSTPFFM
jgi:ABC-type sugar transport system permease subunit